MAITGFRILSAFGLLIISVSNAFGAEWIRGHAVTNRFMWGAQGGLAFAIPPNGFKPNEPRGLIRLGYPNPTNDNHELVNFIAIEPVVKGRKGFSELEKSALDGVRGKRLSLLSESATDEKLTVRLQVERFENGAEVALEIQQRADRPDEVVITTHMATNSTPMDFCILTATMGNMIRARELWLKDKVVTARELYPHYRDLHFTAHTTFNARQLLRLSDGSLIAALTTDEADPAAMMPFERSNFWHYRGAKVTQYWRHPLEDHRGLVVVVNARHTYYGSKRAIPNGNSFENFEMRKPFQDGQQFVFGITKLTPQQLGFPL